FSCGQIGDPLLLTLPPRISREIAKSLGHLNVFPCGIEYRYVAAICARQERRIKFRTLSDELNRASCPLWVVGFVSISCDPGWCVRVDWGHDCDPRSLRYASLGPSDERTVN